MSDVEISITGFEGNSGKVREIVHFDVKNLKTFLRFERNFH